eukprot:8066893-Lingulodinium_polyedra.AAC.1
MPGASSSRPAGEAVGAPPSASSAAGQSAGAAAAGDLSHFQQYIVGSGKYWAVNDKNGKVLGHIQPMSG